MDSTISIEELTTRETRTLLYFIRMRDPELASMARMILYGRISELSIANLCRLVKYTPSPERKKYLAVLDDVIGLVSFENYSVINEIDYRYFVKTEVGQLITAKITAFFDEVLRKEQIPYEQLVLLAGRGSTKFSRIFRNLIKQRGLTASEKKDLLNRWPDISRFWVPLIEEELDNKKAIIQRFSDAIYRENYGEIQKIIETLSKTTDK